MCEEESLLALAESFREKIENARTALKLRTTLAQNMLVRLVLLQHGNELGRDTATGPLLSDERMRPHASVQAWTWHSCDDNERIGELLGSLASPALLWAAEGKVATSTPQAAELVAPTYVLLDGTWQEAEEVFSRGPPCLRAMARLTLPAAPSAFWLRSPFAGKARFGEAGSDGQGLVCSHVENTPEMPCQLARPSRRRPLSGSGGLSRRRTVPQAAPSFGRPRPASAGLGQPRPAG